MAEAGTAYAAARDRMAELIGSASEDDLARRVPACPDWTTKDLLAHVSAIAVDTTNGNIEGAGSAEWTDRQIQERKDKTTDELVAEWRAHPLEPLLDSVHPAIAGGIIGDLVTHEQDARGALGIPGGLDSEAFEIALDSYVRFFGRRIKESGLPALEVTAGERTWTLGKGEPTGTLTAEPFDLLRGVTGRRTVEQIRAFDWGTDPESYLAIFSMYGLPDEPLPE